MNGQSPHVAPGRFIVLSSPSGGGKSTITKRLLADLPRLVYSVSATTRPARPGEVHGQSYWFLSPAEFLQWRDRGDLLEWEEVYGFSYGTPRRFAERERRAGNDVIFDLDVKGALRLKQQRPETVLIFLSPPSMEILVERLQGRGTEDDKRLRRRLAAARWECDQAAHFDHIVINDKLDKTVPEVKRIIEKYRKEDHRL